MRQKTPHPRELKAKAHKLFGGSSPAGKREQPGSPTAGENGADDHHRPAAEGIDKARNGLDGHHEYEGNNEESEEVGKKYITF